MDLGAVSSMNALQWTNVAALMGIPTGFFSALANSLLWDGLKLLVLGSVIETWRKIFFRVMDSSELLVLGT